MQRPDPAAPPSHPAAPSKDAVRGAALLAALAASGWLFTAGAANAATGSRSWQPRRHHRRLGQAEREPDSGRAAKARPPLAHAAALCHHGRVNALPGSLTCTPCPVSRTVSSNGHRAACAK